MSSSSTLHDCVVVGAGVAGSVIAARLSEQHGARVLLLEAGGSTPPPESAIPPVWPSLAATEWSWGDDATPIRSASDRTIANPRGRGVGGSSAINGMVFVRGHRDGYADWESAGAKGWTFDDLLPYFKRSETALGRDPRVRGVGGPLVVAPADPLNDVHAACLSAAVESGHRRATDISGGFELGFGPVDLNIVDGRRQSAADAYLWPAIKRPDLQLVTDAVVNRLIIQRGRCIGVEYATGHAREVSRALAGEVILTAGAIGSPQVLMSSGIGPESHLREVGIPVQLDLPGVGSNLQDHAWVMIAHRAAHPVPSARNNHGEVIGVLHSGIASGPPHLQIIFSDSAGREFTGVDGIDHGYAIGVCMMRPFSRGTVRLSRSGTRPIVDPNYFDDDRDMRVMIAGLHTRWSTPNCEYEASMAFVLPTPP